MLLCSSADFGDLATLSLKMWPSQWKNFGFPRELESCLKTKLVDIWESLLVTYMSDLSAL